MTSNASSKPVATTRKDMLTLWGGIAFSLVFTAVIWWGGRFLDTSNFYPDFGANWYFWRLPEPTFWTRATAWGFYLAHQISMWVLIYIGQRQKLKYSNSLHKLNIVALGVNALFILLHFIQTQIWYDGLAQDVSIWSSQISVIILLVWILLMETPRRGLFFGKKINFGKEVIQFARKYHGYYFAWATIYTFWYHPMASTSGHLIGFFYMFLLMLQGSLFFTRAHTNRYWTTALEFTVLVHGALVAVMQGNGMWPMFLYGFAGMFVITQMFGLGLPRWALLLIGLTYIGSAAWIYSSRLDRLWQLAAIPMIEYLGVFALTLIFYLITRVFRQSQANPAMNQ